MQYNITIIKIYLYILQLCDIYFTNIRYLRFFEDRNNVRVGTTLIFSITFLLYFQNVVPQFKRTNRRDIYFTNI